MFQTPKPPTVCHVPPEKFPSIIFSVWHALQALFLTPPAPHAQHASPELFMTPPIIHALHVSATPLPPPMDSPPVLPVLQEKPPIKIKILVTPVLPVPSSPINNVKHAPSEKLPTLTSMPVSTSPSLVSLLKYPPTAMSAKHAPPVPFLIPQALFALHVPLALLQFKALLHALHARLDNLPLPPGVLHVLHASPDKFPILIGLHALHAPPVPLITTPTTHANNVISIPSLQVVVTPHASHAPITKSLIPNAPNVFHVPPGLYSSAPDNVNYVLSDLLLLKISLHVCLSSPIVLPIKSPLTTMSACFVTPEPSLKTDSHARLVPMALSLQEAPSHVSLVLMVIPMMTTRNVSAVPTNSLMVIPANVSTPPIRK